MLALYVAEQRVSDENHLVTPSLWPYLNVLGSELQWITSLIYQNQTDMMQSW